MADGRKREGVETCRVRGRTICLNVYKDREGKQNCGRWYMEGENIKQNGKGAGQTFKGMADCSRYCRWIEGKGG